MSPPVDPFTLVLVIVAVAITVSTVPYVVSAIDYRQRDNGLAYLLFVMGVGVWNGMFVAQLLTGEALVQGFFLALAAVGSVQAGLGFLLFATTASSTPDYLDRRAVYAAVGALGGLDIVLAVTTPAHELYWSVGAGGSVPLGAAAVEPHLGFWLHTVLLATLVGIGVVLFFDAARDRPEDRYLAGYVAVGTLTVLAVVGSAFAGPGTLIAGAVCSGGLTTIGWLQATQGHPLTWLRGDGRAPRPWVRRSR